MRSVIKNPHLSTVSILKILANATVAILWQWHHISDLILVRVCATATGEQNGIKLQHKLIASNYQLKPIWYIYFRMTSLLQELPKIRETFGNLKTVVHVLSDIFYQVKGVNVLYFLRALMLHFILRIEKKKKSDNRELTTIMVQIWTTLCGSRCHASVFTYFTALWCTTYSSCKLTFPNNRFTHIACKTIRRPAPRRSAWSDLIFAIAGPINKFFWSRILHFTHHFRHLRFKNLLSSLRPNCERSHGSHYVVCIFKKCICVHVCHGTASGRGQFIYWRCTSVPLFGSERSTGRNKRIWQLLTLQTQTEILAYIAACRGSQRLRKAPPLIIIRAFFFLKEI